MAVIRVYDDVGIQIDCRSSKEHAGEQNKKSGLIRSMGINMSEIRYPIPVKTAFLQIDRVGDQPTGFKFAAACQKALVGNTNAHEVSTAIDCPHEIVEDDGWRATIHRFLSRESDTRRTVWRATLLNHQFVYSPHERQDVGEGSAPGTRNVRRHVGTRRLAGVSQEIDLTLIARCQLVAAEDQCSTAGQVLPLAIALGKM
jgi:hypothetical protein